MQKIAVSTTTKRYNNQQLTNVESKDFNNDRLLQNPLP